MRVNDFICDRCGESCGPLVIYLVAGTPPDYVGPPLDPTEPGVSLPRLLREILAQPTARREWCVACFAKDLDLTLEASPPRPVADGTVVTQTQPITPAKSPN